MLHTVKIIRPFTNISWRVFRILTKPVPYTIASVNRRNNCAENSPRNIRADVRILFTAQSQGPSTGLQQEFLEGLAKLDVEDGVDERVEEAVDVAEPDEERERERMDVAEAERRVEVVADADGADDVD